VVFVAFTARSADDESAADAVVADAKLHNPPATVNNATAPQPSARLIASAHPHEKWDHRNVRSRPPPPLTWSFVAPGERLELSTYGLTVRRSAN
jgi:hypothetical protein